MPTTARISNIDSTATKDDVTEFLKNKGLHLAAGQRVSFTTAANGLKVAIVSLKDKDTFKKALMLPLEERTMNERTLNIDDDFDGLTTLSEGTQVDIVALHGLNGHAFTSWEFEGGGKGHNFMWLRDSLPEQLPGAHIMTYGYNANVVSDISTGRIRTFAETFLEKLRHDRESTSGNDRPLILIAHSMGGLIIKQALLIANTRADRRFDSILNSVHGIVFIGTPHSGGNGVDTARFVANFVRVFNVAVRVDLFKPLDPHSMVLFDLTDDFRQLMASKGIEIATLFEIKKTKLGFLGSKWIVEERSAVLGVARERKVAINADHARLCKFKNSTDSSLVTTVEMLGEFCRDAVPTITSKHQSTQPPAPEGLKYISLADPEQLDDKPEYPVLVIGRFTYWALSHMDNRYAMTILAYDSSGKIVGKWTKPGARYVTRIDYDEGRRQVSFVGQSNLAVVFNLSELKVTGSTMYM